MNGVSTVAQAWEQKDAATSVEVQGVTSAFRPQNPLSVPVHSQVQQLRVRVAEAEARQEAQ